MNTTTGAAKSAKKTATQKTKTQKAATKSAPKAQAKTSQQADAKNADAKTADAKQTANAKNSFESAMSTLVAEMNDRFEMAVAEAMETMRDITFTAVGAPIAFRTAVSKGDLADKAVYVNFFEEAKVAGQAQVTEFQAKVDPYFQQFADRVEPLVGQLESLVPSQVQEAFAAHNERVRKLVNA